MKTITGREINVRGNKALRTFTIRTEEGFKYRTYPMSRDEFNHASDYWTGNDWANFLRTDVYYEV